MIVVVGGILCAFHVGYAGSGELVAVAVVVGQKYARIHRS